jgi:hypothetical protein
MALPEPTAKDKKGAGRELAAPFFANIEIVRFQVV